MIYYSLWAACVPAFGICTKGGTEKGRVDISVFSKYLGKYKTADYFIWLSAWYFFTLFLKKIENWWDLKYIFHSFHIHLSNTLKKNKPRQHTRNTCFVLGLFYHNGYQPRFGKDLCRVKIDTLRMLSECLMQKSKVV